MSQLNHRAPQVRFIAGVTPSDVAAAFTFEGECVNAWAGESLACALMRAGHLALRHTRVNHAARGYFCGMGLCWECAVHVQGQGVVRACCHAATAGQVVSYADEVRTP